MALYLVFSANYLATKSPGLGAPNHTNGKSTITRTNRQAYFCRSIVTYLSLSWIEGKVHVVSGSDVHA